MKVNSMNELPSNTKDISLIMVAVMAIIAGIVFTFMGIQISKVLIIVIQYLIENWVVVIIVLMVLIIFKRKIWDKK